MEDRVPEQQQKKIQVLIVDDHEVVRLGLRLLIDARSDVAVCGEAASAGEAIAALAALQPDLVLLDRALGTSNGRDVLKAAADMKPRPNIVVLSMADEAVHALQTLKHGALGYVMKDAPPDRIIEAIRRAAEGQTHFSPSITAVAARHVVRHGRSSGADLLSAREQEVLDHMGKGEDFDTIGTAMGISPRTVDIHARNICRKLGLASLVQLRQYALAQAQDVPSARGPG